MLKFIQNCWQEDKDRRILWSPVLFGLGIACYFAFTLEPSKWLTLFVIETLIILAIVFRHRISILRILGFLAIIVAGFATIQLKSIWLNYPTEKLPSDTFYFKGQIVSVDTNYQGRKRFTLKNIQDFDGKIYKGKYRITQRSKKDEAEIGDCVEMVGTISPLSKEVIVDGYQFDRKGYFEGLKGSGFAESRWFKISCSDIGKAKPVANIIANWRQKIVKHIQQILPSSEAAIASAIIAGERGAINEEQYTQYRNSGLAHFLSISGLHMSMLAGLMFFLVRFVIALFPKLALRIDSKKIAAIFAIILSLIYLFISGNAIPAQRAFIMTFVVLLGVLTNRRAMSIQTISLAAFIILLVSPEVLVSASFQMSFAAVLGLIAFYEKISHYVQKFLNISGFRKWVRVILLYILGIIISDFIASVMTLPFAIYHFNMIAVYTTLGNFLAGPVIGLVIMPFVLLSLLFMPLGLDTIFLKITGFGIGLVNQITSYVASLPNAAIQVPSIPHWGLVLIIGGGLWFIIWQAKWRYWGLFAIVIGLFSIITVRTPDIIISPDAKVVAFKNKQGKLEIVSSRSGRFIKDIWQNKYSFASNKANLQEHPEIKITGTKVIYNNKEYNLDNEIGMSIYINSDGSNNIKTIRDDIGYRYWNK